MSSFVSLEDVKKIYQMGEVQIMAAAGIDFQIERGEFAVVVGPSGAGKTTVLNILGGMDTASSGRVIVDGKDIAQYSPRQLTAYRRDDIGFVFQFYNLIPNLTALENVELALQICKNPMDAQEVMEDVGLGERLDNFPAQLSGGEQQRVAIAVALANEPEILLADEPTGAVDTKTSSNIQDLFRKLNRELGLTIIIVTHDMKLAHKVDRVVMISDGKISTEKILKQHYRDMLDQLESPDMTDETHEEYSVLDKAHRVQLSDDMLAAAGIDTNKVKVRIEDGRVVIEAEEKKE